MPTRVHIIAILLIIAVPLALMLIESRYNTATHTCAAAQTFTLAANAPGNIHAGNIRLEGAVHQGSVTISGFPGDEALGPQTYTAGASINAIYDNEMYGPPEITFTPSPGARCDLRLTYRLASDISLLNPLW